MSGGCTEAALRRTEASPWYLSALSAVSGQAGAQGAAPHRWSMGLRRDGSDPLTHPICRGFVGACPEECRPNPTSIPVTR